MKRCFWGLIILTLLGAKTANSQDNRWTKEDSIWLQRVLSGKEQLRLTDEAKVAIERGTLIAPTPNPADQLKAVSPDLPIVRSFEGITAPEHKQTPLSELPPGVFMQYGRDMHDSLPDASRAFVLYDRPRSSSKQPIGFGISITFDADDLLKTIFWPTHRAKKRNRKHANAWKNY